MINVPLFLPIHCRKTTVPNSIREGLRKKYTENNTNKQNKPNKKKKTHHYHHHNKNTKRLEIEISSSRNRESRSLYFEFFWIRDEGLKSA